MTTPTCQYSWPQAFRHGQHLAFDRDDEPLSNLFVTILQQMGMQVRRIRISQTRFSRNCGVSALVDQPERNCNPAEV